MDNIENFIEEAMSSNENKSGIFERGTQYFYRKFDDNNQPVERRLTNFTITILSSHYRDDGIYREIVFNSIKGVSESKMIAPDCMYEGFKSFLASCGNYSWWGTSIDLVNLWNYLYQKDSGKVIYEPECIGWQEDHNMFMFENIAFKSDEQLLPDDSGTFWVNGKGIRPRSISAGKNDVSDGLPYIMTKSTLDIHLLRAKLHDSMPRTMADQCLGWCASVFFMEECFKKFHQFPFLFITGKRRSGKSTIAQWLTYLFGFESCGRMWSDTTPVAMGRYLGYYSSLPLWLDEYRNDTRYSKNISMMRNVYNRQGSGKGTRDGFTVREPKIRGTLIISGEETPNDNALLTRCIVIPMSENTRSKKVNHFNWFNDNQRLLSNFSFQLLANKSKLLPKYLEDLEINKNILEQTYDSRLSINKAIVATGFSILYGDDKDFARGLLESTVIDNKSQEEESAVSVFFNDVGAMLFSKDISNIYIAKREECIYIYFYGLYNEWARDYKMRKGEPPFKLQSLRGYLSEEPGFLNIGVNCRMEDNSVRSCVKFLIEESPEYIRALVQ